MKKILLADNDESVSQMLGQVLELERYQVLRSRTGRETTAMLQAELPDLVLLDLNLPERNGWQIYDLIHQTCPSTPIIIITALSCQQERAASLGAILMEKPLDLPLLLELIRGSLAGPEVEAEHLSRADEHRHEVIQPNTSR
jgi:DNA-binding response OmpR family regulator